MADVESLELQIIGDSKGAIDSINTLIDTLDRLKQATSGGCGLGSVANGMNKVTDASNKSTSSNGKSALSFAKLATKVAVAYQALNKAGDVIAGWINESNEYIENVNLFSVSMGKYAESAYEYAEKVGDVMGIDPSDWIRSQGVFMTLATGFGVAEDRASTLSQQLTQLGYDLSSFYNISVEEAMQKLQSGISGELEPLRRLGYDLSQAKLEATALSLGIDKAVSSMTQAEKAELRYYAIMTQVTQVQGDMARTLTDPANQLRILSAQVTQAARAFGNLFIPVLNAVLPVVIAAVKVITMLAQAVASLFGMKLSVDFSSAGSSMAGIGASAADTAESINDAAGGAKKLRKILLGIDELNVLPEESSGGGGGGGGGAGGGGGFDFDLPTYDFIDGATSQRINEITEKIKEWLGITDDIDSWSELMDTRLGTILRTVGLIGLGFAAWELTNGFLSAIELVKGILASPIHSITIGATLAITGFTLAFDGMEDAIENGLDGFNFGEILGGSLLGTGGSAMVGSALATWIEATFGSSVISTALTQAGINLGVGTFGAVGAALAAAGAGVIAGLGAMFVGIYDAIKNGIDWLSGVLIPIGGAAAGAGVSVILTAIGTTIAPGLGTIIGLVAGLIIDLGILIAQNWDSIWAWLGGVWTSVVQWATDLWSDICGIWNVCAEWFNTNVIIPIVGFFSGLWTSVSGFFVNLWADIVAIFTVVAEWFNTNVITPVIGFFGNLWAGIVAIAEACWQSIVDTFSPVVEWFAELFGSVLQTLDDIFYNIGVIATGCWDLIEAVWGIVSEWFNTHVIQPIGQFFSNLWSGIIQRVTNACNAVVTLWGNVTTWIDAHVIQPIGQFFSNLWTGIQNIAIWAWTGIQNVFATITGWINANIIQPVGALFSNLWAGFMNAARQAWAGVQTVFGNVATFFRETFEAAWAGVVRVFSVAGEIFVNIRDGIVTAFRNIVNGLIGGLNQVISRPFNAINTALNVIKNITILGLTPFKNLRTISVPQIPYLAEGGMVNDGQMFVAREAGPELVGTIGNRSAVVNNDQIVDSVSQGVYRAVVHAMAESGGNQVVEAKVNDKVLFEVVVGRTRQETMRMGYNPLLGGV